MFNSASCGEHAVSRSHALKAASITGDPGFGEECTAVMAIVHSEAILVNVAGAKDSGVPDALEVTYKPGDWPSALPMPDLSTPASMGRPTFLQARQQRTKNGMFFRGFSASALF